jgi:PAS domain S-box-containing protein
MDITREQEIQHGTLLERVKNSIYCVLTTLSKDAGFSPFVAYMELTIIFMQELSFSLSPAFPWNKSILSWLSAVLKFFRFQINGYAPNSDSMSAVTYLFLSLGIFNLCLFTYLVVTHVKTQTIHKTFIWKVSRILSALLSGFLFVPIFSMGGYYLMGRYVNDPEKQFYFGASNTAETGLVLFMLLLFFGFTILHETTVYQWVPMSNGITARTDSRAVAIMTIFKGVTSFIFALVEPYPTQQVYFLLGGILLVHHAVAVFIYWYDVPFYTWAVNKVYVCYYGMSFWGSCCALLSIAINNKDDAGPVWMFYSGVLLCVPTCMHAVTVRIENIGRKTIPELSNGTEVDIKVRLMQFEIHHQWEKSRYEDALTEKNLAQYDFEPIDNVYLSCLSRFPHSAKIFFSWSAHAFAYKQNRCLAMSKLRVILDGNPFYDDQVAAQTRLRFIADVNSAGHGQVDNEVDRYIARRKLESVAIKSIVQCLKARSSFWKRLTLQTVLPRDLQKLANEMDDSFHKARKHIQELVKGNPSSSQYRRFYGKFLSDLANDDTGARAQMVRASELDAEVKDNDMTRIDIGSTDHAVIILSGERTTIGRIIDVNQKACQTFGYAAGDLLGKNINMLMPKMYSDNHDEKLRNHLYKTTGQIMNRYQLAMTNVQGFVFHARLQVREYAKFTLEPSVAFLGVISPFQGDRPFIIADTTTHQVSNISSGIMKIFEINKIDLRNGEVSMHRWIPEYDNIVGAVVDILGGDLEATYDVNLTPEHHKSFYRTPLTFTFCYTPYLQRRFFTIYIGSNYRKKGAANVFGDLGRKMKRSTSGASIDSQATGGLQKGKVRYDSNMSEMSLVASEQSQSMVWKPNTDKASEVSNSHSAIDAEGSFTSSQGAVVVLKRIMERQIDGLEPGLRRMLRWIFVVLAALTLLVIAVQLVWEQYSVNSIETALNLIMRLGTMRWAALTCQYSSSVFFLIQEGIFDQNKDWAMIQRDLKTAVRAAEELSETLYVQKTIMKPEQWKIITEPNVQFYVMDNSTTNLNLLQALQVIQLTATMVLNTPFEGLVKDPRHLEFFKYNSHRSFQDTINITINSIHSTERERLLYNNELSINFLVAAVGIIGVLFFLVFLPSHIYNELQKMAILHLFDSIPTQIVRERIRDYNEKLSQMGGNDDIQEKTAISELFEKKKKKKRRKGSAKHSHSSKVLQKMSSLVGVNGNAARRHSSVAAVEDKSKNGTDSGRTASGSRRSSNVGGEKKKEEEEEEESKLKSGIVHMLLDPVMLQMMMIVVLVVGYFSGLHLWWTTYQFTLLEDISGRVITSSYRTVLVRHMAMSLTSWNSESRSFQPDLKTLLELEDQLWEVEHASVYGNVQLNIPNPIGVFPETEKYVFSDMCASLPIGNSSYVTQEICRAYKRGILRRGLHESLLSLLTQSELIRYDFNTQNGSPTQITNDILSIKYMADELLPWGLFGTTETLRTEFDTIIKNVTATRSLLCGVFIVLLNLMFFFVYRPMVYRMDESLKRTRALISILPQDIIEEEERIRQKVYALIKKFYIK